MTTPKKPQGKRGRKPAATAAGKASDDVAKAASASADAADASGAAKQTGLGSGEGEEPSSSPGAPGDETLPKSELASSGEPPPPGDTPGEGNADGTAQPTPPVPPGPGDETPSLPQEGDRGETDLNESDTVTSPEPELDPVDASAPWELPSVSSFPATLTFENNTPSEFVVRALGETILAYSSVTADISQEQYERLSKDLTSSAALGQWTSLMGVQVKYENSED